MSLKARLGLFDNPYRQSNIEKEVDEAGTLHRNLAREAASKSIVLLKNESGLLPITSKPGRIAIIVPLADAPKEMLGSWYAAGRAEEAVSVLAGLRAALPTAEILHDQGVTIADDEPTTISEAVALARSADLVLLCIGESAAMSGETASRAKIDLPGRQHELASAIINAGRSVVVLLFSGRPICAPSIFASSQAVLACWFPGTEAGHAVADILTGGVSPTAQLPITWPRHVGQVPIFFSSRSGGRPEDPFNKYTSKYLDLQNTPEFPFGHGLSYTEFSFQNLAIAIGPTISVSFDVINLGQVAGETTVFVFIRDPVASVARPKLEMRKFVKVKLAAFESASVSVQLQHAGFFFLGRNLVPTFEPGDSRYWSVHPLIQKN